MTNNMIPNGFDFLNIPQGQPSVPQNNASSNKKYFNEEELIAGVQDAWEKVFKTKLGLSQDNINNIKKLHVYQPSDFEMVFKKAVKKFGSDDNSSKRYLNPNYLLSDKGFNNIYSMKDYDTSVDVDVSDYEYTEKLADLPNDWLSQYIVNRLGIPDTLDITTKSKSWLISYITNNDSTGALYEMDGYHYILSEGEYLKKGHK